MVKAISEMPQGIDKAYILKQIHGEVRMEITRTKTPLPNQFD